jgi:hypothetical protein
MSTVAFDADQMFSKLWLLAQRALDWGDLSCTLKRRTVIRG